MDAPWMDTKFSDFGPDSLLPLKNSKTWRIEGDSSEQLKSAVRCQVPRLPGVYGMLDAIGRLIYVGKSKSLRGRLLSYFLPHNEDDKAGRIVQSACAIVWEPQPSEFAALVREQYLIRQWRPRFNVQGLPKRQRPVFVCLGRGPAEQLYTARTADVNAIRCIGPLQGASRAARAVEVLNRSFKLRDCSSKMRFGFTEQLQLFDIERRPGCIRFEIETCLGPCIQGCSRGVYDEKLEAAKAFLDGKDCEAVDSLQSQMHSACDRLHFEQAARLREDWLAVDWLSRRVGELAKARKEFTFVYPVEGVEHCDVWYLIRRGIIEGSVPAPRTAQQRARTERKLQIWLEENRTIGSQFLPREETLALVSSWFRNNRGELKRTFSPCSIAIARSSA